MMNSYNKIMVVLDVYNDYSATDVSLPLEVSKAIAFAEDRQTSQLYLVGCGFEEYLHDSYSDFGPNAIAHRKQFIAEMEGRLEQIAEILRKSGYQVDCRVHWTYPRYEQIAKEAENLNVDLVVQHAHSRQPHEKHNLSHDSWQLIKSCSKPLLLTKDKEWAEQPVILAAVDPVHSHHKPEGLDYKILNHSLQAKALTGGTINIVHACPESARPFADPADVRATHSAALTDLLKDYDIPESSIHLIDETPVNAVVHCQDKLEADITFTGALSRSRLAELIIGNTAARVLDYLKSDLFIIHPES